MPVNDVLAHEQWVRYEQCRDSGHLDFVQLTDKCRAFVKGRQWNEVDKSKLDAAGRPAMTINKVLPTISTLLGDQIQNRTEVLFRPKNGAGADVADALSKVWMQISQNNQLPWVRSDVFFAGLVCGRGFYDVRLDFSDTMAGEVRITQPNSKNIIIDPDASEYDPDSWADVFETKWMAPQDIAIIYSEDDAENLKMRDASARYGYDSIERVRNSFSGRHQSTLRLRGQGRCAAQRASSSGSTASWPHRSTSSTSPPVTCAPSRRAGTASASPRSLRRLGVRSARRRSGSSAFVGRRLPTTSSCTTTGHHTSTSPSSHTSRSSSTVRPSGVVENLSTRRRFSTSPRARSCTSSTRRRTAAGWLSRTHC
ncbi:MAG: hypothetical protein IPN20_04490 [Haliscomenobacter sp.]|nr:hypothetical protein [Haliscomenobacter sp.]